MKTPEGYNNIINHVSEVGGHLRMDRAVGVVPDFLDDSFDGAGCLLDLDPSPVLGRVDFLKVKQVKHFYLVCCTKITSYCCIIQYILTQNANHSSKSLVY